jgi:hypothetical protein
MADQMACCQRSEFPSGARSQPDDKIVQTAGSQIRCIPEMPFTLLECDPDIAHQAVLGRIRSQRKAAAKICLPRIEYRPEVQIHNVILADPALFNLVVIAHERIGTRTYDAIVPVAPHAESVPG